MGNRGLPLSWPAAGMALPGLVVGAAYPSVLGMVLGGPQQQTLPFSNPPDAPTLQVLPSPTSRQRVRSPVDAITDTKGNFATTPSVPGRPAGLSIARNAAQAAESDYSVRILNSHTGFILAHASAYLYHPPFRLDAALDYTSGADAAELFAAPRGWGVLRSKQGLLLWLQLSMDMGLQAVASDTVELPIWLLFEFEAAGGEKLTVDAAVAGRTMGRIPLKLDAGLLHPQAADTALNVQLDKDFDRKVKDWLSRASKITQSSRV